MQIFSQLRNLLEVAGSVPLMLHQHLLPHSHPFLLTICNTAACCTASSRICHFTMYCSHLDGSQKLWESWEPAAAKPFLLSLLLSCTMPRVLCTLKCAQILFITGSYSIINTGNLILTFMTFMIPTLECSDCK